MTVSVEHLGSRLVFPNLPQQTWCSLSKRQFELAETPAVSRFVKRRHFSRNPTRDRFAVLFL